MCSWRRMGCLKGRGTVLLFESLQLTDFTGSDIGTCSAFDFNCRNEIICWNDDVSWLFSVDSSWLLFGDSFTSELELFVKNERIVTIFPNGFD